MICKVRLVVMAEKNAFNYCKVIKGWNMKKVKTSFNGNGDREVLFSPIQFFLFWSFFIYGLM
jgi:hypothetical protein